MRIPRLVSLSRLALFSLPSFFALSISSLSCDQDTRRAAVADAPDHDVPFELLVEVPDRDARRAAGAEAYAQRKASADPRIKTETPGLRPVSLFDARSRFSHAVSIARRGLEPVLGGFDIPHQTERYDFVAEEGFLAVGDHPLSTFALDVDTASYSNIRRFLMREGRMPPSGAVRIEEMVNYFSYDHATVSGEHPLTITSEVIVAPWAPRHRLVMIGVQAEEIEQRDLPPRNLVFLVDVSGSMDGPDRLGLVKRGLSALVSRLRPEDYVSLVVYASASGLVLPPTSGAESRRIFDALERLEAGGSTNGGEGIALAYSVARQHYHPEAVNRVILATDGDFNLGVSSPSDLIEMIERERESGVFLTVLGVGTGNLQDASMEALADHGNGNYAYLDSFAEARKVLVREAGGTLVTVAKDVKIQVEFNPEEVSAYRLIGYENRRLQDRDFNDDKKDAGELGAGHSVTALYEIVPVGVAAETGSVDPLKYQRPRSAGAGAFSGELLTVKLRYKRPNEDESLLLAHVVDGAPLAWTDASADVRFGSSVALFGMLLRQSDHVGEGSYALVREMAEGAKGLDEFGYRSEFVQMVAVAGQLGAEHAALEAELSQLTR